MPPKVDAAANWTAVKAGDQLTNLTITIAAGAASIRGRLPLAEGAAPPSVYLVPAETERAEDVLSFFVTEVAADGAFALNNLPPGRYKLFTQPADETQPSSLAKLREPEAAPARVKLRKSRRSGKDNCRAQALPEFCQRIGHLSPIGLFIETLTLRKIAC